MYQPAGTGQRMLWRRSNVEIAGIMIAGNCILCLVIFGFGLLMMGTISMAASTAFDPKPSDPPFFRDQTNVPRIIGTVFLSIGAIIFGVGLILLFIIIRKAKTEARNYPLPTTYPGPNYDTMQPYPSTGQAQTYQPVISGQGQPYPPGPGQTYPPTSGPGQTYPPTSGPGQPYPPFGGPGEPYPPVPGQEQPYPASGGVQQYPPAGGIPDKNPDQTNLPYNPGYPRSGYPGSDHPPPDAPPPYSDRRP